MARKASSTCGQHKMRKVMREFKAGTLKSGRGGGKVTSRAQAIAIGMSEKRKACARRDKNRR